MLGLRCCGWASSICGAGSFLLLWLLLLWSMDSRARRLRNCGRGFCCPVVCGIFQDQELNLCPLRWQVNS